MSLKLHWFLPTSGDGRSIVGRGHSVPLGADGLPAPSAAELVWVTLLSSSG